MKSVAQQLSEVHDSLKAAGHIAKINEVTRQEKSLEGQLVKLTEFAESHGATPAAVASQDKLVEAAKKSFGMTQAEAEIFANPNRRSASLYPELSALLKETK
jgi:hypothetical protein